MANASEQSDEVETGPSRDVETGPGRNVETRQSGCMVCRLEVGVDEFAELNPGDQISMPGAIPLLGFFYSHHAIIKDIELLEDGKKAKLTVIDVSQKNKIGTTCLCRGPIPIEERYLNGKDSLSLSTIYLGCSSKDIVRLRKIVYRKRKFDRMDTIERGHQCQHDETDHGVKYCFCLQNCEHFANACVNGPDNLTARSLKESIAVQSIDFLFVAIYLLFWALQAFFYGFNFWMYAVFVANDTDFNFLTTKEGLRKLLENHCVRKDKSGHRVFQTKCDWEIMAIFLVVYIVIFALVVVVHFRPLKKKKYLCKRCFCIVCINLFFSRLFIFVLVESLSILLEEPLYKVVTKWHTNRAETIAMLFAVSVLGATLIYSLASLVTKMIVWIWGKRSESMETYHSYVHLKGLLWCFWSLRCCCRDNKKELANATEMRPMSHNTSGTEQPV